MLYDIRVTAEQLKAVAEWSEIGDDFAMIELQVDDHMLLAEQGDERIAFDTNGEAGSEEYLAVAPIYRKLDDERAPLKSIQAIVDYNWTDEERDYEECASNENEQSGHIFEHLERVEKWLNAVRERHV